MEKTCREEIVIYEPNQRVRMGFVKSWATMARSVAGSRELIWQLFKRDFFSNYKQSYLGVVWIFIAPAVGIVSWVFLNATGVLKPGDVGVPYPVYILLGSTIWGLFMGFYGSASASLTESGGLIVQVKFPHEALVIKQVAQTVAAFLVNIVLILVVLVVFRVTPSWKMVFFPLTVIPLMLLGAGLGMMVSVVSAVAHDFGKVMTALLGFLMYLTPVIYSPSTQNDLIQTIVYWNPLAYLINGSRDIILYGFIQGVRGYVISNVIALVFFMLAWRVFFLSEHKVAEKL